MKIIGNVGWVTPAVNRKRLGESSVPPVVDSREHHMWDHAVDSRKCLVLSRES